MIKLQGLVALVIAFVFLPTGFGQDTYGTILDKSNSKLKEGVRPEIEFKVVANNDMSEIGTRLLVAQCTDSSIASAFPSTKVGVKQKINIEKLGIHEDARNALREKVKRIEEEWESQFTQALELHKSGVKVSDDRFIHFFAKARKSCSELEEAVGMEFLEFADPVDRDSVVRAVLRLSINYLKCPCVCKHLEIGQSNRVRIQDHFQKMKFEMSALLSSSMDKHQTSDGLEANKKKSSEIASAFYFRVFADLSDSQIDTVARMVKDGESIESFRLAMSDKERKIFDDERKWMHQATTSGP